MKIKPLKIDTNRESVVFIRKNSDFCRAIGSGILPKVELKVGDRSLYAILNTIEEDFLERDEIGLCTYTTKMLGLPAGSEVEVRYPEPVRSVELVRAKVRGEVLGAQDYRYIIRDIIENRYSKVELTAFVVGCSQGAMDRDEIAYLSEAMADLGENLEWGREMVVDKHCIGGVPGNRTTMLAVPIVAAYGLPIPKTSSRAITSPSGTADTMEVLASVDIGRSRMKEIVERENGCLAWGGAFALSPADDIIISVERPLNMDAPGQMIASILSKKKAAGSTHVLLDIPVGDTAKVRSYSKAISLRKLFEYVGGKMGLHVEVILTDGSQPIGRGIGPSLEARDVMSILANEPGAPEDLRKKGVDIAGRIIDFDPSVRGGRGRAIAEEILKSGRALDKMNRIISAQGPKTPTPPGALTKNAEAVKSGRVASIQNHLLAKCAKLAGAPQDQGAGVFCLKKVGDEVKQGEPLFRIHAEQNADLGFAWDYWQRHPEIMEIR